MDFRRFKYAQSTVRTCRQRCFLIKLACARLPKRQWPLLSLWSLLRRGIRRPGVAIAKNNVASGLTYLSSTCQHRQHVAKLYSTLLKTKWINPFGNETGVASAVALETTMSIWRCALFGLVGTGCRDWINLIRVEGWWLGDSVKANVARSFTLDLALLATCANVQSKYVRRKETWSIPIGVVSFWHGDIQCRDCQSEHQAHFPFLSVRFSFPVRPLAVKLSWPLENFHLFQNRLDLQLLNSQKHGNNS